MFWFFGHEACGIPAPRPGIEPASPALEGEVLTTGPPGKSQDKSFKIHVLQNSNWLVGPRSWLKEASITENHNSKFKILKMCS